MIQLNTSLNYHENLDASSRGVRVLVGAGLIIYTMTSPAYPLAWLALLPLLAVYPIFSAITAWDPVKAFFQSDFMCRHALNCSKTTRVIVAAIGVALISSVYVASYSEVAMGPFAVLSLLAVYPILAAILGMDPISALYNIERNVAENTTESARDKVHSFDSAIKLNQARTRVHDAQHDKAA